MKEKLGPSPFIAEYRQFIDTLPTGEYRYGDPQQLTEKQFSDYCGAGYRTESDYRRQPELSPFPEGFIRPYYLDTVSSFMNQASGQSGAHTSYHPARDIERGDPDYYSHSIKREDSRVWEKEYAVHIKQRHEFHFAFLEAVNGGSVVPLRQTFETLTNKPARSETTSHIGYGSRNTVKIKPENINSFAEWASFSLLNVLYASPDRHDVAFQQRAIRLFSESVPSEELEAASQTLWPVGKNDMAEVVAHRLPPSFISSREELYSPTHPQWRQNMAIESLFGPPSQPLPMESACNQLFMERPEDLMQVVLLFVAESWSSSRTSALPILHAIGQLPQPMLDAVMHEGASYRVVHGLPGTKAQSSARALGLFEQLGDKLDARTRQTLVLAARERIANLVALTVEQDATIQTQQAARKADQLTIGNLKEQLTVMHNRERLSPLFARHGINMDAPDEVTLLLINHLRSRYARLYHPESGEHPNETFLKDLNSELDTILRLKGLKKANQAYETSEDNNRAEDAAVVSKFTRSIIEEINERTDLEGEKPVEWTVVAMPKVVEYVRSRLFSLAISDFVPTLRALHAAFAPPIAEDGGEVDDPRTNKERAIFAFLEKVLQDASYGYWGETRSRAIQEAIGADTPTTE